MRSPRSLIDVERVRQSNSGLGQFALNLGLQFLANPSPNWTPIFLLPKDRRDVFGQPVETVSPSWRLRYAPRFGPSYDLWHILHQDASYLPAPGTPYVLTIHDLNFLGEKSATKARKRLARVQKLVDGAAAITVISNFTKSVVEQHLDTGSTPIEVIYNGLCSDPTATGRCVDALPEGEFLFSLGVVRPKKNFHVLVDLVAKVDGVNLVIAGNTKGAYADEIRQRAVTLGVSDRLFILGEVDNDQKVWLFRNCRAFVYPSLYEGFGLSVVESMRFAKPTFCAARTSLPEIGGDDVFYWDDFDPDNMAAVFRQGMQAYHDEPERLDRMRTRAAQFSWENAARQYASLYERILSASH